MAGEATQKLLLEMTAQGHIRTRRTMRKFAESEIVIPDGQYEGRRFSCDRQPFSSLFLAAVEDPYWSRFVTTGPSQSGKTLLGSIIPVLYHLFEVQETVIFGLPTMDMASDKWNEDLLPAIERSRYRELLPRRGSASKGGKSNLLAVRFENGVTLRFMSGGGTDKKRAGFSSRVLVITETDGMDEAGGRSREADKIAQLEARANSYGDKARIYMECTVTVEEGRTWRELKGGSDSRIAIRCPHCGHYVTPEREHILGWQDAVDELTAGEKGALVCPDCGAQWSEEDRQTANRNALLVHRGQTVNAAGVIEGPLPRTRTLGFRWNAANNLLMNTATIARKEWKESRSGDEANAEREMCQFWWAKPYTPDRLDLTVIDHNTIMARIDQDHPRGHVPADTQVLALGTDIGKWLMHWVLIAFRPNATPHYVDYGEEEVHSDVMAEEVAILTSLRKFRDSILVNGWESTNGKRRPDIGLIDARYKPGAVYAFCDETRTVYFPSMGFGTTQKDMKSFVRRGRDACVQLGEEYQVVTRPPGAPPGVLVEINSDHWKGWLNGRIQTPIGQPGALTLFGHDLKNDRNRHLSIAKHLTSEKKIEEFVPGKGTVTRWFARNKHNHKLDASAYACVAAHTRGVRLMGQEIIRLPAPLPSPQTQAPANTPPAPSHQPGRDDDDRTSWMPPKPSNWMDR
jgi:phage terminase large subunit GpA-like protein